MSGKYLNEESKKQFREQQRKKKLVISTATRWMIGVVVAVIILLNLFTHVFQIVRYNGAGMEPNLRSGQTLILRKTQSVEEGDIIAFYYNNQVLVRRVICTGGKQLSIAGDGTVSVNGVVLEEDYLQGKSAGQCNISFPSQIEAGDLFVMGDNRQIAMDSRLKEIGTVPVERVIGKVVLAL